jgi:hypothetical protein
LSKNAERIALIVELATRDAKDKLGRELAAYNAELALNEAFGNSRRWLGLADRLASSGRAFVDELATKIRAVATHGEALATYSEAVEGFLANLDSMYQSEWAKGAPWRQDKEALPPPAWRSAKGQLDLAFQVQQSEFEQTTNESAIVPEGVKGPQWKRFDEAVNLVAWLLTSPKAPTDYSRAGARNLARLVNETKVRCRAGSIVNIRLGISTSLDSGSREGQSQLRLITSCVADAIVQGSQRPIPPDRTVGADLLSDIRSAPQSFPLQAMEWLKAADKATGKVGKPEEIARAYLAFTHAFDTLEDLHGDTAGRAWRMTSCDRATSSYSFAFGDDGTTIDVMGLQFSWSDMWSALGENPEIESSAVGDSTMAVTSTAKAEKECREWLATEFLADPEKKRTKLDFQTAALAEFVGRLSVRGFIRAWDAVAPQAGRSTPGRKS